MPKKNNDGPQVAIKRNGRKKKPPTSRAKASASTSSAERDEPKAVRGKSNPKVKTISLDDDRRGVLFNLTLDLSKQLGKRVTASELIRIGIDCVAEMDEDALVQRLADGV